MFTPSQPAPRLLDEVLASLTPERILARAREIEAARAGAAVLPDLVAHFGIDEPSAWVTPFEWLVGLIAVRHGVIAFDRLDRAFLPTPEAWVDPAFGPAYYRVTRRAEALAAPPLWPFAMDLPVADFTTTSPAKWLSHGLVHTLIGARHAAHPTEWELMAEARLSEALAAVHWYNLAELGRLGAGDLPMDLTDLRGEDAVRYAAAAARAHDPASRLARLDEETALAIADNALAILHYELAAWRRAVLVGELLEPEGTYLGLGEACEYARVHRRRLACPSHARWRDHCITPGVDDADSAESFERRVAAVAADLGETPVADLLAAAADGRTLRLRRVLQDIGHRLCHAEALEAGPGRFDAALGAIAAALRDGPPAEPGAVLDAVGEAVVAAAGDGPVQASQLLALGYAPLPLGHGPEPAPFREARRKARLGRAFAWHPAIGTALAHLPLVLDRALDLPARRLWFEATAVDTEDLAREGALSWEAWGYLGWLTVATAMWRDGDAVAPATRWHFRLSHRKVPADPAVWKDYELVWNPYVQRIPTPYDPAWETSIRVRSAADVAPGARFKPRSASAIWYCLIGTGWEGPLHIPLTTRLNALVQRLKRVARLDDVLAGRDFDVPFIDAALADGAVLLVHRPALEIPERPLDPLEVAMAAAASVEQRREEEGPWADAEQLEAYAAFCARWPLYRDASEALCEAVGIAEGDRVAELGFGTGETTRAILLRLGPSGRVVAADPALRVVSAVFDHVDDPRARFLPGAARALLHVAATQAPFDRVVANSSIHLAADIPDELAHCFRMLRPGGRLAVSMPAEYLGYSDHLTTEGMVEVIAAIEAARADLGLAHPTVPGRPPSPALGSEAAMRAILERCGFVNVRVEVWRRSMPVDEHFDWLAMPVVRKGMVAAGDTDASASLIQQARARLRDDLSLETVWALIIAECPAEAAP